MTSWIWTAARIVRVIDGDTVDAMLTRDLGFGGVAVLPVRLRLNRINAPKVTTVKGIASRDRVAALVTNVPLTVTTIQSYKYGGPDDQVGEYMAEVVLPDGTNLSDLMIAEKLAVFWTGTGTRPADD
jgi:endonuclease YncB( thermonuclease family)